MHADRRNEKRLGVNACTQTAEEKKAGTECTAHQRQTLNLTTVKTGTGRQRARRNRTYSTVNTVNTGTGK